MDTHPSLSIRSAVLSALAVVAACSHRPVPATLEAAASTSKVAKQPELTRVTTGNLFDAYAGGTANADAAYRGKRLTVVGNVVAVQIDAGVQQIVLGSKLQPVTASGIDVNAAASLVIDAPIEIDCTVTGVVVDIPNLDCGPNGLPRPVSAPP